MYYESLPLCFDEGLILLLGGGGVVANTPYTI